MLKAVSSITNAIGALNFKGTWDANANSPALASSVGTKGDYYVVGTAGSTNLNGISNWGVGDFATYNGSVWQRVEGGADLNGVNVSYTGTLTGGTGVVNFGSGQFYKNAAGQFGFGTDSPIAGYRVHISGDVRITNSGAETGAIQISQEGGRGLIQTRYAQTLMFGTEATDRMSLSPTGDLVLIGSNAQKATGLTWSNPSDKRLKDNIRDYEKGLAELLKIRVCEWEYNGKGGTVKGTKGLGVIADDAMLVLPNTVENYEAKLNPDDQEVTAIKKFDASEITWLLVKTVQEQQSIISNLTARVAALESK